MRILNEFRGLKNVISIKLSYGVYKVIIFDSNDDSNFFVNSIIIDDNIKKISIFETDTLESMKSLLKGLFVDYEFEIIKGFGSKMIAVNTGLLKVIKHTNGGFFKIPEDKVVFLYVESEKEKGFEIKSNKFFYFDTMQDPSDIIFVTKDNEGVYNFSKCKNILKKYQRSN